VVILKLSEKRVLFTKSIVELINYIENLGYYVAIDYVKRCHGCKISIKNSCHEFGLAADLILYDPELKWLNGNHKDTHRIYSLAHDFWDKIGGSHRIDNDLGHFSFEHMGIR
jgi:hypothetical protein